MNGLNEIATRGETTDQYGWLIEEDFVGHIHWLALSDEKWPKLKLNRHGSTVKYLSPFKFVKDSELALRFARKEDAGAFAALFSHFLGRYSITEHCWPTQSLGEAA